MAGLIGTGLMTIAQELSAKLQSSGDDGEQGEGSTQQEQGGQDTWEQASAPAKVANRISEGVFHQDVSAKRIPLLTHGMQWGYGTGWGAVYGLAQGSLHAPTLRHGLVFGSAVRAMSYVQLVPMGLYQPPWKYPPKGHRHGGRLPPRLRHRGGERLPGPRPQVTPARCVSAVWGVPNLFLTDGSALPTQGAANPALTIMARRPGRRGHRPGRPAESSRIAERVAAKWGPSAATAAAA